MVEVLIRRGKTLVPHDRKSKMPAPKQQDPLVVSDEDRRKIRRPQVFDREIDIGALSPHQLQSIGFLRR